jgi:GNAT superfamily N-acetyltransferase
MKEKEVLESLSKEELVDLILEYSDSGYFPLELFILTADYAFTADDIKDLWECSYYQALEYEHQRSDLGAVLLRDVSELCFERAKRFKNADEQEKMLEMLTDDLTRASEEDGIGNYTDSEWLYDEVREEIEKWKTLTIRCASASDLDAIESVYNRIHDAEEKGEVTTGWIRSVYPVRATAEAALRRQDLFVEKDMADGGRIVGTAIINQTQVDVYDGADWQYDAPESQVMVLHTLVIDPAVRGHGYGKAFVQFYEQYAEEHGCNYLRMDTNERNRNARSFYTRLGYREADIVPCVFNGIPDVSLVLLEKKL